MGESPAVTVIVPVYNGAAEIGACIEALLAQDAPPGGLEIVVVDNGSTDATRDVVRRYPVILREETERVGSYAARNRGAEAARGPILGFTDADCVPAPGWVAAACKMFEDPDVVIVGASVVPAAPRSEVERYLEERGSLSYRRSFEHPYRPYFPTAGVFYRREAFRRAGGFNSTLISGGDADLSWRLQAAGAGQVVFCPEAQVEHRHRSDVRQMRRQQFKWGLGGGSLSRLHGAAMGPVRRRIDRQGYANILSAAARLVVALPGAAGGAAGRVRLHRRWWDVVNAVHWKAGYIVGLHFPRAARRARL